MNIPKNATGNPKATQKANLVFRKRLRKMSTRTIPIIAFSVRSSVRCTNVLERSETTLNCTLLYFTLKSSMYSFTFMALEIRSSELVLVMTTLSDVSPL